MSTKTFCRSFIPRRGDASGVALIVTLSLLVLVTVAVVAFFSRTIANQQIVYNSAEGVDTDAFSNGAADEIIGSLQKEMFDGSGVSPQMNKPTIMPMTNAQSIVPSRMVSSNVPAFPGDGTTTPDPTQPYAQFANLVKQSISGVPTYNVGGKKGLYLASSVHTSSPTADGRNHDGIYWSQPQLVSTGDPNVLTSLVPDWIYTVRNATNLSDPTQDPRHPLTYSASMVSSGNGALGTNVAVGRYAYNIYDTGGLINANLAGYGVAVPPTPTNSKTGQFIPGYKGSILTADLGGLALGGALKPYNTSAAAINNWQNGWQSALPVFRYPQVNGQSWSKDFAKLFVSGQISGWIQPYLVPYDPNSFSINTPSGTTSLVNSSFTSRQDLITWAHTTAAMSAGDGTPQTWILPYLTHFSYDTDAPTFTPDANRPRSNGSSTPAVASGGNDSTTLLDDLANPSFLDNKVLDSNGYPMVKHRFPLSAISLLDNIYPTSEPPDLTNTNSTLYKQIQYDFGLVWNSTYKCWDYKDLEGSTGAIKQLKDVPKTRSPNFFELLKATITVGSLGKQWGNAVNSTTKTTYDQDVDNALGANRYSTTAYQIIQIGANIISQCTTHYIPTTIALNGSPNAPMISGVKDLPYLYRTRLLQSIVGAYQGKDMYEQTTKQNSSLIVATVQPELWNPHAPNPLAQTGAYPQIFRIVPDNARTALTIRCAYGSGPGHTTNWASGGTLPTSVSGDYTPAWGANCSPATPLTYNLNGNSAEAFISFTSTSSASTPIPLSSFRDPCPLAAPNFPPGANADSSPKSASQMVAARNAQFDGKPNTQVSTDPSTNGNTIPATFTGIPSSQTTMGFVLGYYGAGPGVFQTGALGAMNVYTGAPMSFSLQYSMDGSKFYTYDQIESAFPSGVSNVTPPQDSTQTQTGVRVDPRTNRWGLIWAAVAGNHGTWGVPPQNSIYAGQTFAPSSDLTVVNYGTGGTPNPPTAPNWNGLIASNTPSKALELGWAQVNQPPDKQVVTTVKPNQGYYADPDGVVRRADGAFWTGSTIGLPEAMVPISNNTSGGGTFDSRPVVLNRAFQSVAELGYVFRDTPWRSLDFFTPESGDAALLDVFCTYGPDPYTYRNTLSTETALVAGKVNLNTRQIPVIAALLKGAAITTPTSNPATLSTLSAAQATSIATGLVKWTTNSVDPTQGTLRNPAEIVGKFVTGGAGTSYSGFSSTVPGILTGGRGNGQAGIIKQQLECVTHALGDTGTTRTWNLLIDLVAQTGRLPQSAASGRFSGQPLQNFVVNGERHLWVSVAIDRVTGKVMKMQVEPVRL